VKGPGFLKLAAIVQQVGEIIQRSERVDVLGTERSFADGQALPEERLGASEITFFLELERGLFHRNLVHGRGRRIGTGSRRSGGFSPTLADPENDDHKTQRRDNVGAVGPLPLVGEAAFVCRLEMRRKRIDARS